MKSRLSSTIWTLVFVNGLALFIVLGLAYHAGRESGGVSLFDFGNLPSGASGSVMGAALLALGVAAILAWRLSSSVVTPVQNLTEFSERLAAGRPPPRAQSPSHHQTRLT